MTDWLIQAIGPALLILFLGSFAFMLVLVFYWGPHTGRLQWILGLFIASAVLVSRIGIELGRERATLYLWPLAAATLFTTSSLVTFENSPFVGILGVAAAIAIMLWLADRLTWDTTVIDASRDASAQGLLQVLRPSWLGNRKPPRQSDTVIEPDRSTASDARAGNLLKFLWSPSNRANTPGLWVIYTALVTLPAFAIGQWLVPADYPGGFGFAKWLFAVHLAAGLGLMMTTSLLGLQRYLIRRRIGLPGDVARTWIIAGIGIVAVIMVLVWVTPQVRAQSRFQGSLNWLTARERPSDRGAVGSDGKEQKSKGNSTVESENPQSDGAGGKQSGGTKGSQGTEYAGQQSGQTGQAGNQSQRPRDSSGNAGQQQQQSESGAREGNRPNDNEQSDDNRDKSPENSSDKEQEREKSDNRNNGAPQQKTGSQSYEWGSYGRNESSGGEVSPPKIAKLSEWGGKLVRWIGILALFAAAIVFRKEIVAAVRECWALIMELLGGKRRLKKRAEDHPIPVNQEFERKKKPFADFRHPFRSNLGLDAKQIVIYTFAALEALGRELGHPRRDDETPNEFAVRLAGNVRQLHPDSIRLSEAYCRLVFGQGTGQIAERDLQTLWDKLIALNTVTP